ncbi:MAG: NADH-quinone oxidoreductase subunit NuoG [Candidatus Zixiibacteriota bacterium]|nr:MAG: NADH-quinone oxidoreductase subunit NuoG [candidate division Zixibacteria bacterium]
MSSKNGDKVTLTIDGREVTVPKGITVLEAARSIGIDIPTFCWHPKLKSVGACRICYVEIAKMPKLAVSCATEVMPGMVVHTESEKVRQGRRAVLEFILLNHPLDCPTCDKGGECDLQDHTFAHGIDDSRFDFAKYRFIRDKKSTFDDFRLGPEIIRNQNRCILCYKCVRANKEVFGEYDIGAFQRGNSTEIDAAPGQEIDSIYSGNLVEICPVGALTNTDWRYKIRVWKTQTANSVCQFCADGCNLMLWKDRDRIYRATSRCNDGIDEGWICDRGRYGYQVTDAGGRLTTPLIKRGERQEPATWDEAVALIARRFKEIKDKKGGVCIGGLVYPGLDSASLYAFSKLFRTVLSSNNVDFRTDYKMLPEKKDDLYTLMTLQKFSIADIEKADLVLVIGSDLINEHPITNLRVRKAVTRNGAKLYTLNPFATKSGDISVDEMIHEVGTIEALINGICISIIEQKLAPSGPDTSRFTAMIEPNRLEDASRLSGIEDKRIISLAKALGAANNISLITGELLTTAIARENIAAAILNLAILAGIPGQGQIGFLSKYANSKGAERLGVMPHLDSRKISRLKDLWGEYPEHEGMGADRLILSAKKEEIDSILVIGCDPLSCYPDGQFVREGIEKLDFLVVADLFETRTTQAADVVLPLSSVAESAGSFVNLEGKVQQFDRAIKPIGQTLPGYEICNLIASELKGPLYDSMKALQEETVKLLEAGDTPELDPVFHEVKLAVEKPDGDYNVPLYVVDQLHHFGHLTEKSQSLSAFCNEARLEISPSLAERLHATNGTLIRIESEVGKVILPVFISENVDNEVALVYRNFSATPVNVLQMRKRRVDYVKLTRVEEK